jgi:hypothetical protein
MGAAQIDAIADYVETLEKAGFEQPGPPFAPPRLKSGPFRVQP